MAGLNDLLDEGGGDLSSPGLDTAIGNRTNKELMAEARMSLSGNWGMAILGFVLFLVLNVCLVVFVEVSTVFTKTVGGSFAAVVLELLSVLLGLFLPGAITVGFFAFFLGIVQKGRADLELLFTGFKYFFKCFVVYFFTYIFIFLWSLLFLIPGIVASLRYSMAFFIVVDDNDCGPFEALKRSAEMMKGNKWKLLCLDFRLFSLALLFVVPSLMLLLLLKLGLLGSPLLFIVSIIITQFITMIGWLLLAVFSQTSFAKFYEDVK